MHPDIEMGIIIALVGIIIGYVSGFLMGVHTTTHSSYLMQQRPPQQRRVVPSRPQPHAARTQVLYRDEDYGY